MKKIVYLLLDVVLFDISDACSFGTPQKDSSVPYPPVLSMSPNTKVNAIAARLSPTEITAFSKLEELSANFGNSVEDLCMRVSESLESTLHIQDKLIEEINAVYLRFFSSVDTEQKPTAPKQTAAPKQ